MRDHLHYGSVTWCGMKTSVVCQSMKILYPLKKQVVRLTVEKIHNGKLREGHEASLGLLGSSRMKPEAYFAICLTRICCICCWSLFILSRLLSLSFSKRSIVPSWRLLQYRNIYIFCLSWLIAYHKRKLERDRNIRKRPYRKGEWQI